MITTKNGDLGYSSTIDKHNIPKDDIVFELLGTIDELSAFIGLAKANADAELKRTLETVQSDLVSVCGYIAGGKKINFENLSDELFNKVKSIEHRIKLNGMFVLYGSNTLSAMLDIARSVARRAERVAVAFCRKYSANIGLIEYLNRMSDYLYVEARLCDTEDNK